MLVGQRQDMELGRVAIIAQHDAGRGYLGNPAELGLEVRVTSVHTQTVTATGGSCDGAQSARISQVEPSSSDRPSVTELQMAQLGGVPNPSQELASGGPRGYLRAAEAAALLHVSPKTISRWAREGKLGHVVTLGGHRRFSRSEIEALAERMVITEEF